MKKLIVTAVAALSVIAMSGVAGAAGSTSQNFTASATVLDNCTVTDTTLSTLAFGAYDPTSPTDATASGSISVQCTKGTVISSYITGNRFITIGGGSLTFEIYEGAAQTTVYGNAIGTARSQTATSAASAVVLDYNAVAAANQDLTAESVPQNTTLTMNIEW